MGESLDLPALAKNFSESLPQDQPDILDQVVRIHIDIALCGDIQEESAVKGHAGEKVIEERQACAHLSSTRRIGRILASSISTISSWQAR